MSNYSFDDYGWYSKVEIPTRTTKVVPPECGDSIVGHPYPNFTGYEWILLSYVTPIPIIDSEPLPAPEPIIQYKTILTPFEFKNRFTSEERIAARVLSKTDMEVDDLWDMLNTAQEVDLNDPMVIYGLPLLVSKGVLTQIRCDEILTKYPI